MDRRLLKREIDKRYREMQTEFLKKCAEEEAERTQIHENNPCSQIPQSSKVW